jgi:uncharacterized membrane protein
MTWAHATRVATATAALGAGLSGGVFLAFSTFVMSGLRRLPAQVGVQAMQGINRAAPSSPVFMLTLFGTTLLAVALAVESLVRHRPASALAVAGAAAVLVAVVVTAAYHVPHNDALALLDPTAPATAARWRAYTAGWTRWNHLRTASCAASAVLLGMAAARRGGV